MTDNPADEPGHQKAEQAPSKRGSRNAVLIVAALAVIAALVIYYIPRPRPDCMFSGWKSTVGVDMDAKVGDLDALHAKVGLTSEEVREFDTLLKDYALKYDAACNDVKNGRMNQAEYTCRRRNMDELLDTIRMFPQAVDAAKSIADPQEQARQLRDLLQRLSAAAKAGYAAGCVSAMSVDPGSLTFAAQTPERSLHIGNGGNNDLTFAIDGLPEAFLAQPTTGTIPRGGQPVTVSIYRTLLPAATPVTFRVRSNFQEERTIQLTIDGSSTALYEQLGAAATARAADHQPTVADALAVVDPVLPPDAVNRPALKYFLAMGVLTQAGKHDQALEAYQSAVQTQPALKQNPVALLSKGVVLSRQGDAEQALLAFNDAQKAPGQPNELAKSAAAVLGASVELSRGKTAEAEARLRAPGALERAQTDATLGRFLKKEHPRTDISKAFGNPAVGVGVAR